MMSISLLVPCFLILLSCHDIFAKQGFFWYKGDESNHDDTFYNMLHCLANDGNDCINTRLNNKERILEIDDAFKKIAPNMHKGHITGVIFPEVEKGGSASIIKKMFEELKRQFKVYLKKVEDTPGLQQKLEAEVKKKHDKNPNDVQEIVKGIVESHFLVDLLEPWIDILAKYFNSMPDKVEQGIKEVDAVKYVNAVSAVKTSFEKVEENYDAENFDWPDTNFGWLGEADSTARVVSGKN